MQATQYSAFFLLSIILLLVHQLVFVSVSLICCLRLSTWFWLLFLLWLRCSLVAGNESKRHICIDSIQATDVCVSRDFLDGYFPPHFFWFTNHVQISRMALTIKLRYGSPLDQSFWNNFVIHLSKFEIVSSYFDSIIFKFEIAYLFQFNSIIQENWRIRKLWLSLREESGH